ncbi:hypothetical protein GQ457_02G019480 [Hibiscus cannabinus]
MTFQDPWYRYPSGGIDTQGTDTLLMFFKMQDSSSHFWYRYSSRVSIPKGGTDTLTKEVPIPYVKCKVQRLFFTTASLNLKQVPIPYKGGIDTHCPEWARKAEKHPQRLQTRSNGHQRLESLLGP